MHNLNYNLVSMPDYHLQKLSGLFTSARNGGCRSKEGGGISDFDSDHEESPTTNCAAATPLYRRLKINATIRRTWWRTAYPS